MIEKCKKLFKDIFSNGPKATKILAVGGVVVVITMMGTVSANLRKTVIINVDGNEKTFVTYKGTVKDVLQQQGVKLASKDKVEPALDKKVDENEVITVKRAVDVEISAKGQTVVVKTAEDTVENMLVAEKEQLNGMDIDFDINEDEVTPSLDTKIQDNMKVQLVDVQVENEVVVNTLDYDTVTNEDDSLDINTTETIQEGQAGEEEVTYKVVKKDGKEISREKVSSKVLKEPVTEVIAEGTRKTFASRSGEIEEYQSLVYVQATAYYGGSLTATGTVPTYNPGGISTISVDPRVIPLGSLVYVEGYGKAIAADTGGAINGNIIDVYVDSYDTAINWGRKYDVPVYIIAYPGEW